MIPRPLLAALLLACVSPAVAAPLPAVPAPVELVSARPFTLAEPLPIPGRSDLEPAHDGWLLVVAAAPELTRPRQTAQPLLLAGDALAARANHGWPSGRLVIAVLGERDLAETPVWFGNPSLPERASAGSIAEERRLAEEAGIRPFSAERIAQALAAGGEALELQDASELWPVIEALLDQHDPDRPGARR